MDESRLSEALRAIAADIAPRAADGTVARRAKRRLRRNVVLSVVVGVALLGGSVAGVSRLIRRDHQTPVLPVASVPVDAPVEESVRSTDGTLECTARLPSAVLEPGAETGLAFTIRNVSQEPVHLVSYQDGYVRLLDHEGTVLTDSRQFEGGPSMWRPAPVPITLAPGQTKPAHTFDVAIRWPGSLSLVPICVGIDDQNPVEMEPMSVQVSIPGAAPSVNEALSRALEKTDGVFAKCTPSSGGSWVTGVIEPQGGSSTSSMSARCAAIVAPGVGFTVVELRFVAPASAPQVEFPELLFSVRLPGEASMAVARWRFLVTVDAVREVEHLISVSRTRAGPSGGGVMCGGMFYGGGYEMISSCPP